ncbi:MAG: fumarylacetoacetate hydrolase family protein [Mycobacterium sp.]
MTPWWHQLPARFGVGRFADSQGQRFIGAVAARGVRDITDMVTELDGANATSMPSVIACFDRLLPMIDDAVAQGKGHWRQWEDLQPLSPLDPTVDVFSVLQVGANYREHVIDLALAHTELAPGEELEEARTRVAEMMDKRAAEGTPYVFVGLPAAITGPYTDVTIPSYGEKADWELELVAVIGKPGFRIPREAALDHVGAYTIGNDMTLRGEVFRQDMPAMGTDWFRAKNPPGFLPLGPWLVPAAYVGNPSSLRLRLALNGEVMQDASTEDMLFDVARLVSEVSVVTQLRPGDIILTGSPAGNGMAHGRLLRHGDLMESTITGLGMQRTRVIGPDDITTSI